MGYLLLASLLLTALIGWRSPKSDTRFLAAMSLALAAAIAVQMWWSL